MDQNFIVELVGIFKKKDEVPEDYEKFVDYKYTVSGREEDDIPIAILKVKDTTSYHVIFLDEYDTIEEIDKELEDTLDGEIYNYNIRNILEGHLNE